MLQIFLKFLKLLLNKFRNKSYLLVILIFLGFFFGFSQEFFPNNSKNLSTYDIPVYYSGKNLEKSLNNLYPDILYEDTSFTNNNNDNIIIVSKKSENIKVLFRNGYLFSEVPVQIDVSYRIKKDFNIDLKFFKKPINIDMVKKLSFKIFVSFKTKVTIDQDWNLQPKTTFTFKWLSYPYLSFFSVVSFRVTSRVEPIITEVLQDYATNKIDKNIILYGNYKKRFHEWIELVSKPFLLNEKNQIWVKVKFDHISQSYIYFENNQISLAVRPKFFTYFGFSPESLQNIKLLPFQLPPLTNKFKKVDQELNNTFKGTNLVKIDGKTIQKFIFEKISEKPFEVGENSLKMKITEVYVAIRRKKVYIDVYLRGVGSNLLTRKLYINISGKPFYNKKTKKLSFENLNYNIKSESIIVSIGNWLAKRNFKQILTREIQLSTQGLLTTLKATLNKALKAKKLFPSTTLKINYENIELQDIQAGNEYLYAIIKTNGNIGFYLQDLF